MSNDSNMTDFQFFPNVSTVKYAGFWRRKMAYGIDLVIVFILYLITTWLLGSAANAQSDAEVQQSLEILKNLGFAPQDMDASNLAQTLKNVGADGSSNTNWAFELFVSTAVSAFYNIWFLAGGWQATPGKHWMGMKVQMRDGKPLTLLQSTYRHLMSGVSMAILGLGYITVPFSKEKAALHDMICNTRVVRL